MVRLATAKDKTKFNRAATHVMQSWEWGEFREKNGQKVFRLIEENEQNKVVGVYSFTVHKVPRLTFSIGYMPKSLWPTENVLKKIEEIARQEKIVFLKIEPEEKAETFRVPKSKLKIVKSRKDIFAKSTFVVDLKKSEEELLSNLDQKTRYNVRLAVKKGVTVRVGKPSEIDKFIKLQKETAKRNGFYLHPDNYYRTVFEIFNKEKMAELVVGEFKGKILTAWMLFFFKDVAYYPYGGSASEMRNLMHSNIVAWEALKIAKDRGAKEFDMWGALGRNPNEKDPWFGFHKFKSGYGGRLAEFPGAFDVVFSQRWYHLLTIGDRLRWVYLRFSR